MTIAAITTFGFITGSTVSLAVSLGYGAGAAPPIVVTADTHDLPRQVITQEQIRAYRKRLKKENETREQAYADKLEAANSIRLEIDRILHPPAEDFAEKTANTEVKPAEPLPDLAKLTAKQRRHIADLKRQIGVLMAEAHILEEQRAAAMREWRKSRDEDDMRVISALMNAHITEILH